MECRLSREPKLAQLTLKVSELEVHSSIDIADIIPRAVYVKDLLKPIFWVFKKQQQ